MPEKKLSIVVFAGVGLIVLLAAVALWLVSAYKPADGPIVPIAQTQLTEGIALTALRPQLFAECLPGGMADTYRSCKVELFKEIEGPGWKVWVTYDGLYDDSVRASRIEAYLANQNGTWVVSNVSETNQCHVGRGHQDFSSELCV